MTYSYGNEPIDYRTLDLQNARPGVQEMWTKELDEEFLKRQLLEQEALAQEEASIQSQLQSLVNSPFLPDVDDSEGIYMTMPSYPTMNAGQAPSPPNRPTAVGGKDPAYGKKKPEVKTEDNFSWKAVLDVLTKIARHELTGVVMYTVYECAVSGLYGEVVKEKYAESATEGLLHYKATVEMIKRMDLSAVGGLASIDISVDHPLLAKATKAIQANGAETVMPSLIFSIQFEAEAIAAYKELSDLVCGHDEALENWALTQIEDETRHAFRFEELAGLK